ncbi:MAG: hypothetical protein IKY70_08045 [Bacteroidales bacterium]|nr:hypothetical protein [Bacteroidales bacterium]
MALLVLASCNNDSYDKILKRVIGSEIVIPQNIVKIPDTTTNYRIDPLSKYKLIHYVPAQDCIDCYMKFLVPWKEIFEQYSSRQDVSIYIIFNTADIFDLTIYKEKYSLNYPFFLDPDSLFIKANKRLVFDNPDLNTILTRNDTLLLYGNIENISMKELMLRCIL